MADLHNNISMKSCNITRAGSIIKMYVAVTLLKLQEEGKLDLDDKVTDHLNDEILSKIKNTDKSTIRQLLQHSSGIYNYILNPQFQTASLNNLIKEWQAPDLLFYAKNMEPYFQPGEDVHYSNTGYIILGMLIEKIENKPLYQVLDEKIFTPLHQSKSFFAAKDKVPSGNARWEMKNTAPKASVSLSHKRFIGGNTREEERACHRASWLKRQRPEVIVGYCLDGLSRCHTLTTPPTDTPRHRPSEYKSVLWGQVRFCGADS